MNIYTYTIYIIYKSRYKYTCKLDTIEALWYEYFSKHTFEIIIREKRQSPKDPAKKNKLQNKDQGLGMGNHNGIYEVRDTIKQRHNGHRKFTQHFTRYTDYFTQVRKQTQFYTRK